MKDSPYFSQADLILRILPIVSKQRDFALKGGTAINFFYRQIPRLSVDIDLTYLPIYEREKSLVEIEKILLKISDESEKIQGMIVSKKENRKTKKISGLILESLGSRIKIEPNPVIRGTVFPSEFMSLSQTAQDLFQKSVKMQCLSIADLFGGKICAALDRQHPRDLFDIRLLIDNEGITDNIRKAFIVYLISHSRPMRELLQPNLLDIRQVFENEFLGMTNMVVTLEDLIQARDELITIINKDLTDVERRFLLGFKQLEPDWSLIGINHIKELPAVKWKLLNLKKMDPAKRKDSAENLRKILDI